MVLSALISRLSSINLHSQGGYFIYVIELSGTILRYYILSVFSERKENKCESARPWNMFNTQATVQPRPGVLILQNFSSQHENTFEHVEDEILTM
jgi:hypothetical protein